MTGTYPHVTLNNGVSMPALGLGVYQSKPEETTAAVVAALNTGYRHIDTAAAYFNETEVGEGIRRADVDRDDVFIETKLWITDYGYDAALHGFDKSARKLGVDTIDLLLLHQPLPSAFDTTVAAYKALETLLADGRVRSIGVSNQSPTELQRLLSESDIVPAVNQIQLHPYYTQPDWQAENAKHGIITQCWSPIAGSYTYNGNERNPFEEPTLVELGRKYGKTPAQVMLRWHLDHGFSAIPKSVKPERIEENFDVFDFALTANEIAAVDALNTGVSGSIDPDVINLTDHAYVIPE
ncbi:aldo/keto reductase [Curtobacterium pusillum]|uniref:aldo/keto reductase n=1 Tax=Curtobacterium pusillum TaxID=69373 RepID=UPI0037FC6E5B